MFKPPPGHQGQTRLSWLIEELAGQLLFWVGTNAIKRGDKTTTNRIRVILNTAGHHERSDAERS